MDIFGYVFPGYMDIFPGMNGDFFFISVILAGMDTFPHLRHMTQFSPAQSQLVLEYFQIHDFGITNLKKLLSSRIIFIQISVFK